MKSEVLISSKYVLVKSFVLRGVKVSESGVKTVTVEKEFDSIPSEQDIANFLNDNKIDFCSMSKNYRLEK